MPTASGFDERAHLAWGDVAVGRSVKATRGNQGTPEAVEVRPAREGCGRIHRKDGNRGVPGKPYPTVCGREGAVAGSVFQAE